MELLKIIIAEYILGYIFQSCIFFLGIYAFNRKKIEFKKFIICVLIYSTSVYIIRSLPITFGIHTLIGMVVLSILSIKYLKLPQFNVIKSVFVLIILLFTFEYISLLIMESIFGKPSLYNLFHNHFIKALMAMPSSLLFAGSVFILYRRLVLKHILTQTP